MISFLIKVVDPQSQVLDPKVKNSNVDRETQNILKELRTRSRPHYPRSLKLPKPTTTFFYGSLISGGFIRSLSTTFIQACRKKRELSLVVFTIRRCPQRRYREPFPGYISPATPTRSSERKSSSCQSPIDPEESCTNTLIGHLT